MYMNIYMYVYIYIYIYAGDCIIIRINSAIIKIV